MPFQMHDFLSMVTLGKLPLPSDFLLDFEKSRLAHVIGSDRKLRIPHEIQNNTEQLEAEIETHKKHNIMIVAIYVFAKVLIQEVYASP